MYILYVNNYVSIHIYVLVVLQGMQCTVHIDHVSSVEQCLHHGLHVEVLEVTVGLSSLHKHYGLTCDVRHRYGSSHLRTWMGT